MLAGHRWLWVACAALFLSIAGGGAMAAERLVVYSYDSFASWGPAKQIEQGFEASHDVDVVFVAPGSSGEMLARLIAELDTGGTDADVFVGLSDTQLPEALQRNLFRRLDTSLIPNLRDVPTALRFDRTGHVVPFDHGYIVLVYDREALSEAELPRTLEDLTRPSFRRKLIAIDPRTSSVGHAFLMWTIHTYGEDGYLDYWRRLRPSLLTVTGGWSEAYEMFTNKEAPIVVSYSTDAAYAVLSGEGLRYGIITPQGEGYRQIEGAGIVRTTDQPALAHAFIDYLLSPEVQALLPSTQVMFPVNARAALPEAFEEYAVQPERPVWIEPDRIAAGNSRWLREWSRMITE
ncbi:MAG TPA: thiamine ABC transporter substrate binding subunit [Limnochordia bacterium]